MLSKFIEPLPFFANFFWFNDVLYTNSSPQIVFKHPTPENVDDIIYKDNSDNCYKYEVDEVKCPINNVGVKEHPINN